MSVVVSTTKAKAKSEDSETVGVGAGAAISSVDDITTASISAVSGSGSGEFRCFQHHIGRLVTDERQARTSASACASAVFRSYWREKPEKIGMLSPSESV